MRRTHRSGMACFAILFAVLLASLYLPRSALGQLTVLPTSGKSLGCATAPEPGQWLVFGPDSIKFVQPTILEGGKAIWWEGDPGLYAVVWTPPSQPGQIVQPLVQNVTLGKAAEPPKPPDPPKPTDMKWQVAVFVESNDLDNMPLPQLELTNGLVFRRQLAKDGHVFLGCFDKDRQASQQVICRDGSCVTLPVSSRYDAWWRAIAGKQTPLLAIASKEGGDAIQVFSLPADAAAFAKVLSEARRLEIKR